MNQQQIENRERLRKLRKDLMLARFNGSQSEKYLDSRVKFLEAVNNYMIKYGLDEEFIDSLRY